MDKQTSNSETVETNSQETTENNNNDNDKISKLENTVNGLSKTFTDFISQFSQHSDTSAKENYSKYTDETLRKLDEDKRIAQEKKEFEARVQEEVNFKAKLGDLAKTIGSDGEEYLEQMKQDYNDYNGEQVNGKVLAGLTEIVFKNPNNTDNIPKIFQHKVSEFNKLNRKDPSVQQKRLELAKELMPALHTTLENRDKNSLTLRRNGGIDTSGLNQVERMLAARQNRIKNQNKTGSM